MTVRLIRCPVCGLTVHAPVDKQTPDGGPKCAMGHPETSMVVATATGGQG